jgi:hypothetical protein
MKRISIFILLLTLTLFSGDLSHAQTAGTTIVTSPITSQATTCQPQTPSTACVILQIPPSTAQVSITIPSTPSYSGTLQFEGSTDGGNTWVPAYATPNGGGTAVTSTTASGVWFVAAGGFSFLRVRASSYTSGTASITLNPSQAPAASTSSGGGGGGNVTITSPVDGSGNVNVDLQTALPAGANSIGAVTEGGTWNVRVQDGSGNAITSNSTTQSRSLDVNLVSVIGATLGATNPLFIQPVVASVQANSALTAASESALTTAVVVKASSGILYGFQVTNGAASVCYLEFINAASSPTLGTAATYSFAVPASGTLTVPIGMLAMSSYTTGVSVGMATTYNGATACGTAATAVIFYK